VEKDELKYLQKMVDYLQDKYNFNPEKGAVQVKNLPSEVQRAFGQFDLIKKLIIKFKLDINLSHTKGVVVDVTIKKKNPQVYFIRSTNDPTVWKIGRSIAPENRKKQLQTGNPQRTVQIYNVLGDYALESKLKIYLDKYKISGEWFRLSTQFVDVLVSYLKKEEPVNENSSFFNEKINQLIKEYLK
jgi:hypothetical protein